MFTSFEIILGLIEFVITVATLVLVAKTYLATRSAWARREFISRVNFSLNYVEGNTLRIRTVRESDINQILLNNEHGKQIVLQTAKQTSLKRPFLEFQEPDRWMILNAILNELSEQFARGFVAHSAGIPVRMVKFMFGVSCERDPRVNMNKIRVMLIERSLLERIDELGDSLVFERESHAVRLETLIKMKEMLLDKGRSGNLFEVELAFETSAS